MISESTSEIVSFRDPAGRVVRDNGRVFRVIALSGRENVARFFSSTAVKKLIANGSMVRTWEADADASRRACAIAGSSPEQSLVLEHECISFPSFPYEWSREMLYAAAEHTLNICEELLDEGNCLKDATPYNVLFKGAQPVFVDVLSVEGRDLHDPVWLPYAQFLTTFVLPLLASKELGIPLDQVFLTRREGLKPEELFRGLGFPRKLKPVFLFDVVLPTLLGRSSKSENEQIYQKRTLDDPERVVATIRHLFSSLRRKLKALAPGDAESSAWSDYDNRNSYSHDEAQRKQEHVKSILEELRPKMVLDIGCNRGTYSRMAARAGASVVAIDSDPVVVGLAYAEAQKEGLDVLPLVVDISRPSPSIGWMNEECPSFLDRATKRFDLVFMLAVLHHLQVTERIPTSQLLDLVTRLTTDAAVIEYVSPEDPMFRRLVRGREQLYAHLTEEAFETACRNRFGSVRRLELGATRSLYVLRGTSGGIGSFSGEESHV